MEVGTAALSEMWRDAIGMSGNGTGNPSGSSGSGSEGSQLRWVHRLAIAGLRDEMERALGERKRVRYIWIAFKCIGIVTGDALRRPRQPDIRDRLAKHAIAY